MANQFTNPIRYFKANDPYYYEVDNIPLKQLQENCLYLREQLTEGSDSDISRNEFTELKPYALGGSHTVSVKPGRFTGRVNEAYKKGNIINLFLDKPAGADPAAYTGASSLSFPSYTGDVEINNNDDAILDIIYSKSANLSYPGLNGLLENIQHFFSTFNWLKNAWNTAPYSTSGFTVYDNSHTSYAAGTTQYGAAIAAGAAGDPLLDDDATGEDRFGGANGDVVDGLGANADGFKEYFPGTDDIRPGRHFRTQEGLDNNYALGNHISHYQTLATLFTIKWKGVFRTSIVDVKSTLSIEVPNWDENDFGATDVDDPPAADPSHRIDLLFIYTHPVDSDETYISKYKNTTTPESITAPQLGIVRGAAVVSNRSDVNDSFTDADGNRTIQGNLADTLNPNLGFEEAAGSFPSPDDLMNLAPLIAADIEEDNLCLVGQSILPVAYIRVNNPGESGPVTINSNDIIDIRPFFRTAELAYNERAGIAAANPPLSIANPAIGKTELWNATDSILSTPLNEFAFPESGLNMNENIIMNMADPTALKSAATKGYVDAADDDLQTTLDGVNSRTLGQTSWSNYEILPVSMNFERIVNLGAPEALRDATTKEYVDERVELDKNPMIEVNYTLLNAAYDYLQAYYIPIAADMSDQSQGDFGRGVGYGDGISGNPLDALHAIPPQGIVARNFEIENFNTDPNNEVSSMIRFSDDNTKITFKGEDECAIWKVVLTGCLGNTGEDRSIANWGFGVPYITGNDYNNLYLRRLSHCPQEIILDEGSVGSAWNLKPISLTSYIQFGNVGIGDQIPGIIPGGGEIGESGNDIDFGLYISRGSAGVYLTECTLTMERVGYTNVVSQQLVPISP